MGATMSSNSNNRSSPFFKAHQMMSPESSITSTMGPNAAVSAHHQMLMEAGSSTTNTTHEHHDFEAAHLFHDMMSSLQTSAPPANHMIMAGTPTFGDQAATAAAGAGNFLEVPSSSSTGRTVTGAGGNSEAQLMRSGTSSTSVVGSGNNNVNDGLTRDFLGLKTFPTHGDQFFNLVGLDQHMNSRTAFGDHQKHHPDHQTPWQG